MYRGYRWYRGYRGIWGIWGIGNIGDIGGTGGIWGIWGICYPQDINSIFSSFNYQQCIYIVHNNTIRDSCK